MSSTKQQFAVVQQSPLQQTGLSSGQAFPQYPQFSLVVISTHAGVPSCEQTHCCVALLGPHVSIGNPGETFPVQPEAQSS